MADRIFVVPAPGLTVRDPITLEALPPEGAEKEQSSHWLRRERDGDVTFGAAPKQTKKEK